MRGTRYKWVTSCDSKGYVIIAVPAVVQKQGVREQRFKVPSSILKVRPGKIKNEKWKMENGNPSPVTSHRPPTIAPVLHHALRRGTGKKPVTIRLRAGYSDYAVPSWDSYRGFEAENEMENG